MTLTTSGGTFRDQITEAITVRVIASADVEKLQLNKLEKGGNTNPEYAHLYNRDTIFDDNKAVSTPRYARGKLKSGDMINGPAVVTQHNSTTIIPPDYTATVLEVGDILIAKN